ncbi:MULTISPECIES: 2'-5' RNA ligase family protein [Acinetobacter]|jgi:2'-5' RNA ligase|uniref:2'-5' RNA ligase family protein n=1 Tax=Acinetobacter pittii TaxID=48296 RepID=A0AAE9M604_ACIPI|nr:MULTISPECIES: 2'-5' RNA ligase family protein [Acinetobacter calcoaceticus/baumannii complex]AZP29503.1 2'-5' RNA ligase family protein [Acinetobacter pittii]EXE26038.1 2'-5' RNA ligase superfamily protein [Acinetobacter sp. 907131]EXS17544.1 2'-5' RNA ligase superfamily protein [Acinetobacter sp. 883425]KRI59882.1 2'-5' RNA ligase [Acinetobacter pittii]MBK0409801.1 2'-5' RNA ligase family protein [Acinetobacter pittii]
MMPTSIRDYPEWHLGRQNYALWYLEINDQKIVDYLDALRAHFSEFLIEPNHRQYHVTLFICGFLTNETKIYGDDFSFGEFVQQREILRKEDFAPFYLKIGSVDSFSSALFVEIGDTENILSQIRQKLGLVSNEIAALEYCPHITLGLYKKDYSSDLILHKISELPVQYKHTEFDFKVEHLTFGYYQAQTLQGKLYPSQHLFLGDSCCN